MIAPEIKLSNVEDGLLIRQGELAYVAKNWRRTAAVEELFSTAVAAGLPWAIQQGHPRTNSLWPTGRGVVYVSFAIRFDLQWSVAIDTYNAAASNYSFAVFNGKHRIALQAAQVPFTPEKRNLTAGHLTVRRELVLSALKVVGSDNPDAVSLNRTPEGVDGFGTEYALQRELIQNWSHTPFFKSGFKFLSDEYPLDAGRTSRRIDIIAEHNDGRILILELKRHSAPPSAVDQVCGYKEALRNDPRFLGKRVDAAIIAPRFSSETVTKAAIMNVPLWEADWPLALKLKQ